MRIEACYFRSRRGKDKHCSLVIGFLNTVSSTINADVRVDRQKIYFFEEEGKEKRERERRKRKETKLMLVGPNHGPFRL